MLLVFLCTGQVWGQKNSATDTIRINSLIDSSKALIAEDSARAISLAMEAKEMAAEAGYLKGEALALKSLGMVYYTRGRYFETLGYWNQSLELFEDLKDANGMSNMLNNISAIYFNQGADAKALEYSLKSLQLAEKIGDTLRMISALINVGSIYYNKKDPVALDYLLKAIPLVEKYGDIEAFVVITGNIGEIYFDNNDDDKAINYFQRSINAAGENSSAAFSYNGMGKIYLRKRMIPEAFRQHNKALEIAEKFDDKLQEVRSLRGIAGLYMIQNEIPLAISFYNKARAIAEKMDDLKVELQDLYKEMANAYSKNQDYPNAFLYKSRYAEIKDTLYNIESKKKLNQLQFDFELSKKESELVIKEARIKSERQARMGMTFGLGFIVIIAFVIYRNYLQKARINKVLDKQKVQIENLLLNILPKEVAYELQTNGKSKPRHFEEVSILFTDFKGFTSIADKLTPGDLVEELNECFMAFDEIIESYNLEKIKTIGDAYMCAGNIPSPDSNHVYKIVKAGLTIKEYIDKHNALRVEKGKQPWEIRIGLHVGPIVAGVVGKKKYAYDIWGSAVNIASRMESNGTPGKVNISSHAYELIKDKFHCIHRGKIYAKNIGELDMYYVEYEKTPGEMKEVFKAFKDESSLQD